MIVSAIHKVKHKTCSQGANKVQDEAECFISIEVACQVLYFMYSKS